MDPNDCSTVAQEAQGNRLEGGIEVFFVIPLSNTSFFYALAQIPERTEVSVE